MLKSAPYYWVECDSCGTRCEYGDFAAMSDPGDAVDQATYADWSWNEIPVDEDGSLMHCPNCEPFCDECHKPAGQQARERDGMCQECYASEATS